MDGQNHIISNIFINRSDQQGVALFGWTHSATIQNLGLLVVNITGGSEVGALIGEASAQTLVNNTHMTGEVSGGSDYVGGLVGYLQQSTITHSYSAPTMVKTPTSNVGGLVGYVYLASITESFSIPVNVSGGVEGVGGLVGGCYYGSVINNTYSRGYASSPGRGIGGLVGEYDSSSMYNSYSTTNISGDTMGGGLIGWTFNPNYAPLLINNSLGLGFISGFTSASGGLIGRAEAGGGPFPLSIDNSYWLNYSISPKQCIGYNTTGLNYTCQGITDNTSYFQENVSSRGPFVYWDFTNIWSEIAGDYPKLHWQITTTTTTTTTTTSSTSTTSTTTTSQTTTTTIDGGGGKPRKPFCGDGRCKGEENCLNCPEDCGICNTTTSTSISTTSTIPQETTTTTTTSTTQTTTTSTIAQTTTSTSTSITLPSSTTTTIQTCGGYCKSQGYESGDCTIPPKCEGDKQTGRINSYCNANNDASGVCCCTHSKQAVKKGIIEQIIDWLRSWL